MTFSCPNYLHVDNQCRRLKTTCVPGRPGCILPKSVKFSEHAETTLKKIEDKTAKERGLSRKE